MKQKHLHRALSILLALILCFTAVACGGNNGNNAGSAGNGDGSSSAAGTEGSGADEEKVVIVAASSEPVHFNNNAVSTSSFPSISIFSSLFDMSVTGVIIPDLVKDYTVSEDGLTYTFNLHENVTWHDGEPFSSNDVKYTFDTVIQEEGVSAHYFTTVKEVTCPDENTVVFTLTDPTPPLLTYLTYVYILPAHLYEGTDWLDNPANQTPVGTGAFKFVEHNKGTSITLEAYDDYFLGRPEIDKLIFKIIPDGNTLVQAYLNGEVDIIDLADAIDPSAMPSLENLEGTFIDTMISADRQYLVTNLSKEPWSDLRVRQAVAMCLDRQQMVDLAHKGYAEVAEGFYTPAVAWAYTDEYTMPERDIEAAKALLDEAGYTPDADGVRIKDVDIVIFQFAAFSDIATVLKANLKEIGIEASITSLEYAAWDERCASGDFDIAVIGGYHGPDPDVMRTRIGDGGTLNYGKYHNDRIEEIFAEAQTEPDQEKRTELYHEMQKIMSEELPVMPLTEWCYILVIPDNFSGHYMEEKETVGSSDYRTLKIN